MRQVLRSPLVIQLPQTHQPASHPTSRFQNWRFFCLGLHCTYPVYLSLVCPNTTTSIFFHLSSCWTLPPNFTGLWASDLLGHARNFLTVQSQLAPSFSKSKLIAPRHLLSNWRHCFLLAHLIRYDTWFWTHYKFMTSHYSWYFVLA